MTFIVTLVISATKFTLVGSFSDLSSWRISPVVEALIPTARRRQHLLALPLVNYADMGLPSPPKPGSLLARSQGGRLGRNPSQIGHFEEPVFESTGATKPPPPLDDPGLGK